jgi:hypothetical protein
MSPYGLVKFSTVNSEPSSPDWIYHLPTGHLACFSVVFNDIKHPHLRQRTLLELKNGHSRQIAILSSTRSCSERGFVGLNRSKNFTSFSDSSFSSFTIQSPHYTLQNTHHRRFLHTKLCLCYILAQLDDQPCLPNTFYPPKVANA